MDGTMQLKICGIKKELLNACCCVSRIMLVVGGRCSGISAALPTTASYSITASYSTTRTSRLTAGSIATSMIDKQATVVIQRPHPQYLMSTGRTNQS